MFWHYYPAQLSWMLSLERHPFLTCMETHLWYTLIPANFNICLGLLPYRGDKVTVLRRLFALHISWRLTCKRKDWGQDGFELNCLTNQHLKFTRSKRLGCKLEELKRKLSVSFLLAIGIMLSFLRRCKNSNDHSSACIQIMYKEP